MTRSKASTRVVARGSLQSPPAYPFTRIVAQEEMRLALLLNVVEPSIGGVLITGHRGTGKSTAVRALAELLPPVTRSSGCAFNCDPDQSVELCDSCRATLGDEGKLRRERLGVPVVELPLNATEDRVCGAINLERALRDGVRSFEPGLLARAHRGFLYIDEVNLLDDHLVDLLLDVAATGRNRVEREGVSAEHAARFCLVGSSNPEEGELRPQLLDRFGLCAEVRTPEDADVRAEVVARREAFDRDSAAFVEAASRDQMSLRRRLVRARDAAPGVEVPRELIRSIAELCARLGVDGHRGELTIVRAARALAAFEGRRVATNDDARRVAALALRHRLRRDPFEQTGGGQIEQLAGEVFGDSSKAGEADSRDRRDERAASADANGESPDGSCFQDSNARQTRERDAHDEGADGDPHVARSEQSASSHEGDGGDGGDSATTHAVPPADAKIDLAESSSKQSARASQRVSGSRGRARAAVKNGERGRFSGVSSRTGTSGALALDATLRAAAERLTRAKCETEMVMIVSSSDETNDSRQRSALVATEDARFKLYSRKQGTLHIFAVDTSGSMAVNRIGQAKGALARLLRRSYVRRDRVALVAFRARRGEIVLRDSRSPALARRLLDALPVGGATPLASGLERAQEIALRARREGAGRIVLHVFTDGRANVAASENVDVEDRASLQLRIEQEIEAVGASLRRAGVESVVVDTRARFASDAEGKRLARALNGSYTRLPLSELKR